VAQVVEHHGERPWLQTTVLKKNGHPGTGSVVKYLPDVYKVLPSIPSTPKIIKIKYGNPTTQ
jgi:hypothetical protein